MIETTKITQEQYEDMPIGTLVELNDGTKWYCSSYARGLVNPFTMTGGNLTFFTNTEGEERLIHREDIAKVYYGELIFDESTISFDKKNEISNAKKDFAERETLTDDDAREIQIELKNIEDRYKYLNEQLNRWYKNRYPKKD